MVRIHRNYIGGRDKSIVVRKFHNGNGAKGFTNRPKEGDTSSRHSTGAEMTTKPKPETYSTEDREVYLKKPCVGKSQARFCEGIYSVSSKEDVAMSSTRHKYIVSLMIVLCSLTGCGKHYVDNYLKDDGTIKQRITNVSDDMYLRTIGIGTADKTIENDTQRKATAKNAAVLNARYEMLAVVKGLKIEGGIEISRAMEVNSYIKERAEKIINTAEVIDYQWTSDGGCMVTLQLERSKIEQIQEEQSELSSRNVKYGALISGLLIPGGGQFYLKQYSEGMTWFTLAALAAYIGVYVSEDATKSDAQRRLSVGAAAAVFGLVHIGAAITAHNDENKALTLIPKNDGIEVVYNIRF